jgi:CRP-like cAMP-binding protein
MANQPNLNCLTCENRRLSEWCNLCPEDAQLLSRAKVVNRYKAGQTIFYQGNPPLGLYCVESGQVVLRKTDAEGRSVIVRLAGRGQTLGYRAFFSGQTYASSAEAATDCTICWIDKAVVNELVSRNPDLVISFLKHVSQDLAEAENAHLRAATLPIRARLAHFLLSLKDHEGTVDDEGQIVIDLKLSRQDIAAMLGTTPETIARTTRQLTDDQVAIFDKRTVTIPDLDRLLDEVETNL